MPDSPAVSRLQTKLLFLLMTFLWGLGIVIVRLGLKTGLPPFMSCGVRFLLAAAISAMVCRLARVPIPLGRTHLERYAVVGTVNYVGAFSAMYVGMQFISSGLSALLLAASPLMTAVLARWLLGEALSARKAAGVLLGFGGVALIYRDSLGLTEPAAPLGVALLILAAVCVASYTVYGRSRGRLVHPLALNTMAMLLAGVVQTSWSLVTERPWPWPTVTGWLTIAFLAVFCSVFCFTVYFWLLTKVDATRVSMTNFLIPVVTVALGALILGERLTGGALAGGAVVLAGVLTVITEQRQPVAVSPGQAAAAAN